MAITTVANVPGFILYDHILRRLDVDSARNAELSCEAFMVPGQLMRQKLVTMIVNDRTVSDLLSARRIFRPDMSNTTEVAAFLSQVVRHIDHANWPLPEGLRSELRARVLVHDGDFRTIERILMNGPEFTLKKKMIREIRTSGSDVSIIIPAMIVASAFGLGLGAGLGWKALNGRELTVGYLVGVFGGSGGMLVDCGISVRNRPIGWKWVAALISRTAIAMLTSQVAELSTTTSGAIINSTVVGAILMVALRRFERRFY